MRSTTARLLPGDNPQAYLPGDRRRALARGAELPRETTGAALFIDISGFTPLTEALAAELGGRRGAEELTATLDRVFAALLERLHVWRGSVIYFSGDAVTAWLDGDDGLAAVACALEMQSVMADVGQVRTPRGRELRLGVKIAVASGPVHRFVVGDPDVQLIDVLAGPLTDSLASAEQVAEAGDVVVDAVTSASLGDRVVLTEERSGEHGPVGVVDRLTTPVTDPGAPEDPPVLAEALVKPWVLPPVWDRMAAGRGEFLAELRPAVPVFVRFGGLDFDEDPTAPDRLDTFVRRTQRVFAAQGGHVLQLTIGDKGAYLYAVFGAPIAHEDDPARACAAALDLLDDDEPLTVHDLQVGIAAGRLRSGTYGHRQRRTFCCLGDAVNLAARLMARAPAGAVWVHGEVVDATAERFRWRELEPVTVKGKARPVRVCELAGRGTGRATETRTTREPLVGRDEELELLRGVWAATTQGRGQTVVVRAEAGTGKSRLLAELVGELRAQGAVVGAGEGTPVADVSGYAAWRSVWAELLGIDPERAGLRDVSTAVAALDARLLPRAPLLGAVLGLALPDSDLTSSFDGELRKTSLEDLLARLLRRRAARHPVAVVIEDCHWLDPLSRDLVGVLSRVTSTAGVLLVLTSRPDGSTYAGLPVTAARRVSDLALGTLDERAARALAAARHRVVTGRSAPDELVDLAVTRAEGNPFYLEQLVDYLASHASEEGDDEDVDALELPSSLHSLVLSRIDAQQEGPRRAVKVASVIGRSFGAGLVAGAYPDLGEDDAVHGHLLEVSATRLVDLEDAEERRFAFGHAVTRDVAYDSLPYGIRAVLHGRVGDALEREPDGERRHLDLLVHHYTRSEDIPKQRHYLLAAADAARATYAVAAAVDHLQQVLPLVEPDERPGVLLRLAEALEAGGDWAGAEDAVARALEAAADVGDPLVAAQATVAGAELHRKQGRYAEAEAELDAAQLAFDALGDLAGRARVLHLRGTLASQQGDPATARAAYQDSLDIRERLGDTAGVTAMVTNLALCAEDEGDLDGAERIGRDALARLATSRDRKTHTVCLINMGMLAIAREDLGLARDRFDEAATLAEELGDPWMAAIVGHNQGNVARDLGDHGPAARHLRDSLDAYAERDDRWYLAQVLEDVALWVLTAPATTSDVEGVGDLHAVRLLAAAERIREEIGAPRFAAAAADIDAALEPVRARRSDDELAAARAAGETTPLPEVVAEARTALGD